MSLLFSLKDVGLRLGPVQALAGLNLQIRRGEAIALIGANGSGKTSLLRLLHGLVVPSSGALWTDERARQAMVFQRPYMLRSSVLENVSLGLRLGGQTGPTVQAHALQALTRVGLQALAQRSAKALSNGQQQRLALARAWALQADVLLLDEPTASLDPHAKREVEVLIHSLVNTAQASTSAKPMTLIFASHNLGQVKRLARRVIYLEQGHLLADLPVAEFFDAERLRAVSVAADLFLKGELV